MGRLRVIALVCLVAAMAFYGCASDDEKKASHMEKGNAYFGRPNPQYPMYRFVDMTDRKAGFAILNTGIREYEAMDTPDRRLGITLFRAFTYRNCPIFGRWEVYPEMDLAQCIGDHEWTYSIYPHSGDWKNGCFQEAEDLNLPLEAAQAGPHEGSLPKSMSFLEVSGGGVLVFGNCEDLEHHARKRGYVLDYRRKPVEIKRVRHDFPLASCMLSKATDAPC